MNELFFEESCLLKYGIRSAGWAMVLAVGSVAVSSMAGAPLPSDSCLYALSSNGSRAFQVAGGSFTTGCSIAVASTNNEAFQMEGQIT